MNVLSEDEARRQLMQHYGLSRSIAIRVTQIAREHGVKVEPTEDGAVTVQRVNHNSYVIHNGKKDLPETRQQVANRTAGQYTRPANKGRSASRPAAPRTTIPKQGRKTAMAKAPAVEEVEETNGEKDYTVYADKPATATMVDFATWLKDEVGLEFTGKEEAAFDKGVQLGGTLRMDFQRSEFNVSQREARRAAREAEAENEPEAEAAAPAPRRAAKGRGTTAAKAPAKTAAKAPARAKRGRTAQAAEAAF